MPLRVWFFSHVFLTLALGASVGRAGRVGMRHPGASGHPGRSRSAMRPAWDEGSVVEGGFAFRIRGGSTFSSRS
jgi:hypothetical protein